MTMADPVVVNCSGVCTVTHEFSLPPLQLDSAEGGLVAGAILLVWAVGFGFRSLIRALRVDQVSPEGSE